MVAGPSHTWNQTSGSFPPLGPWEPGTLGKVALPLWALIFSLDNTAYLPGWEDNTSLREHCGVPKDGHSLFLVVLEPWAQGSLSSISPELYELASRQGPAAEPV